MSAENPNEQLSQGPEQQEWQGQGWEYLIISLMGEKSIYVESRVNQRWFGGSVENDDIIKEYNEKFRRLKDSPKGRSLRDCFNLLGNDGWELVVGVAASDIENVVGRTALIFKRPRL
ncbi:hypothetical protein A2376_02565 [Candidatus Woesebacteria bacterium RIFOXYB1_FULL_47_31]|uniref:Uncharacterized protein n=3 Tax=Candidatus Woeseibacteriota TaxID=1752722 RepID=A0A1F8D763_9BACT|nr:MAG: hypothetical protein UT72_C0015G0002 [Candidatus Woesebacteria bacterium GW2011_GWB1_40_101]OGM83798.1 MAG: hypothetical protein A2376_02565 [Candidatus Woesebacteria bacterium RIFOXYB1_FULL_47_31]OGM89515.1 MAG: hypothetical protein A2597_00655 [Candidatus Woesebacteria bacterium RIFOXYD1_FULL_46_19]